MWTQSLLLSLSRPNNYPGYQFSLFRWSTFCCIHSLSYMLHHLRSLIHIWCWCILPIQYELILIIVRSTVFDGNELRIWSLTSKLLILWNSTTLFSYWTCDMLSKTYKIIILALNRTEANCASDISFVVIRFPIMHYRK